jgi:hypothetical protein
MTGVAGQYNPAGLLQFRSALHAAGLLAFYRLGNGGFIAH